MKKIYAILLLTFASLSGFAQILADDFNYPDNALLTANGWGVVSGGGTNPVNVGSNTGLTYAGYSGLTGFTAAAVGNAAGLDNTGEDVNRNFTAVTSGTIYTSFLVRVTSGDLGYFAGLTTTGNTFGNRFYVRPSTTAGKINFGVSNIGTGTYGTTDFDLDTTYLIVVKYDVTTTGATSMWVLSSGIPATEVAAGTPEVTASGSGSATIGGVFLRQYNAAQRIKVDGLRLYATWFNTAACPLTLGAETRVCDAITGGLDTYTTTIPFTGGIGSYTVVATSGTVGGDNPAMMASGSIIITGVSEGTNFAVNITGGCAITKNISAPECKPVNTLPFSESFPYTIGASLNSEQKWSVLNTGDNLTIVPSSLTYAGITSSGNAASFSGIGAESRTPFTVTNSGTIYASMMVSVTDIANVTTDLANTYFAYLGTDNAGASSNARIWIRKNGTQIQYGLGTAAAPTDWSPNLYNVGTTQYLSLGYDFASNTLSLFENPVVGGASSATITVTPTTAFTAFGSLVLRQDSATTTPSITVDEIRIDTTPNFILGSASFSQIDGLNMYPNPAKDVLNIETASNSTISIEIYDLVGKQVMNTNVVNNQVNISGLNTGIYVAKITEEGKISTVKIVVE
jgi:Secretion system C-terminal sorting domain